MQKLQPILKYFNNKFFSAEDESKISNLAADVERYKYARYFVPQQLLILNPQHFELVHLQKCFKFLCDDDETIRLLQEELALYMILARESMNANEEDCEPEQVLQWFRMRHDRLPTWASVAQTVALYQVSSAAIERVFSLLTGMFTPQQAAAKADYIESAVMMKYNQRD